MLWGSKAKCPRCKGIFGKWKTEAYNVSIKPPNHNSNIFLQHWVAYRQLRTCDKCGHMQVKDCTPGAK